MTLPSISLATFLYHFASLCMAIQSVLDIWTWFWYCKAKQKVEHAIITSIMAEYHMIGLDLVCLTTNSSMFHRHKSRTKSTIVEYLFVCLANLKTVKTTRKQNDSDRFDLHVLRPIWRLNDNCCNCLHSLYIVTTVFHSTLMTGNTIHLHMTQECSLVCLALGPTLRSLIFYFKLSAMIFRYSNYTIL